MPSFHQVRILPYNPKDLFNLVLDVESYPQFIPWCIAAKIISENQDFMIAELTIKMAGFLEKYQSRITSGVYSNDLENWRVKRGVSERSVVNLREHANSPKFYDANSSKQKNITDEQSYFIEVQAISGPFKHLKNSWQFLQEAGGTRVEFFIDFSMKFSMLNTLVSVFFTDATKQMIDAFEKRAERMLVKTTKAQMK